MVRLGLGRFGMGWDSGWDVAGIWDIARVGFPHSEAEAFPTDHRDREKELPWTFFKILEPG